MALTLAVTSSATAAELRVSDGTIVLDGEQAFVDVDVSWRLSWHTQRNHDAAWLFVKKPASWCAGTPLAIAPDGHTTRTNRGDGPDAAFTVSTDQRGVFVYRSAQTSERGLSERGDNDWRLRLRLDLPEDANLEELPETVDVYGVEMVHVPSGPFSVGDPRPRADSPRHSFFEETADSTAAPPFQVTSSDAIPVCDGPGTLCYRRATRAFESGRDGDLEGPIPSRYPTGFDAFYLMKYPVTQGQYAAFLTDLGRCGAKERTPMGHPEYDLRGSLQFADNEYGFTATRPDRAATDLSWDDAAAFADWAALRPMTELEFEKAARGPEAAVAGEFAWGSTMLVHGDTMFTARGEVAGSEATGDEYVRGNADFRPSESRTTALVGGDGHGGPFRVDIFESRVYGSPAGAPRQSFSSQAGTSFQSLRAASGASYYGVQGLSGGLYERVVTATDEHGRRFRGTHGDGRLLYPAAADVDDWPGPRGDGLGMRGGSGGRPPVFMQISDRTFGSYAAYYRTGGFRAARTE
jgi:formylglycine-generating enzyme required for sulfatase activity